LAALGGFALFVVFARGGLSLAPSGLLLFISILFVLATLFLVFAWRLIWNRARASDGGLFSPLGLRVGGFIFLASPVAAFFTHPIGLVRAAEAPAASGACFTLARHREQYLSQGTPPPGAEDRLLRICGGDAAQAERLIQLETTLGPGISRTEASSRALQRYLRDNH
jgi:hypothetical protein